MHLYRGGNRHVMGKERVKNQRDRKGGAGKKKREGGSQAKTTPLTVDVYGEGC